MVDVPVLSVVLAVAAAATAFLAVAGYRRRHRPGARSFVLLAGVTAGYAGLYAVSLPVPAGPARTVLGAAQWFMLAPIPVVWLFFALEYTGRVEFITPRITVALSVVPALAVAGAVGNAMSLVGLVASSPVGQLFYPTTSTTTWLGHTFVSHTTGPLYTLYITAAYVYIVTGIVVLLEFVVRYDRLYTNQATSLVAGALCPLVANAVSVSGGSPVAGLDLLPFGLPVTAALFANALFRYELLEFVPATRRRGASALVSDMRDPVVVVDDGGRVVDLNDAACEQFDRERGRALEESLSALVGVSIDGDESVIEVETSGTIFEVTVSPVHDRYGGIIGRTLVFRDVTEHRAAQQRLEVLNRVLRHNLRTEVNVISGYATMVETELPDDSAGMAAEISTAADTLDELGRKAREVERIMSRDDGSGRHRLESLLVDAADRVEDRHEETTVVVETPARAVHLELDAVVFTAVAADLVDALGHHDDGDTVTLTATVTGTTLTLVASGEGDGIPAAEYEVVRSGEETALKHASGLSLWLVAWGARSLDGDVTFDDGGDAVLELDDCVATVGSPDCLRDEPGTDDRSESVVSADGGETDAGETDG
ncbi:histidine kinase N-terminal 7TM domain-containing protein [Haloarchaeobius baliensis]|uniref:histidine kinase N-terminal 7TM domain-containing protein n=1 Tax=Haloarchaeobius baliensis TaxID=1670458 RepID=UPI003F883B1D